MLAPRPAGAFVNENEVGAPTQGAKKGLQAKRGLNGPPLLSCDACAHHKLSRLHIHTHPSGCHLIIFTRTHPGRALGNVTNGAKPPQQQQVRPRAILGDISNRAAAPALSAGAKKEELPPVECLHVSDPAPPASFDLTSCARPEAVARAVAEHRAPIFGATARDVGVLEQVRVPSPWAAGASPGPIPTFRGVPPSPFGAEAPQLGQKSAPISHVGSERCSASPVAPASACPATAPNSASCPPQTSLPRAGVAVAQDGAGHELRDARAGALATAGHHRQRLGRGYGARGLRVRGGVVWVLVWVGVGVCGSGQPCRLLYRVG